MEARNQRRVGAAQTTNQPTTISEHFSIISISERARERTTFRSTRENTYDLSLLPHTAFSALFESASNSLTSLFMCIYPVRNIFERARKSRTGVCGAITRARGNYLQWCISRRRYKYPHLFKPHLSLALLCSHDCAIMSPLLEVGLRQRLNVFNGVHRQEDERAPYGWLNPDSCACANGVQTATREYLPF